MRSGSNRALGIVVAVAALIGGCRTQDSTPTPSPTPSRPPPPAATPQTIRGFVTAMYAEGVPYDQARGFGQAAVPELVSFLSEPSLADARSNIVVTLGMIGGATAETQLRKVVEQGNGKLPQPEFRLRLDAELSLGYAANVAATSDTLNYLIAGLQPGVWDSRVMWQPPEGGNPFSRLRERTIIALGLSGKAQAKVALQDLLTPSGRGGGGGGGGRGGPPLTTDDQAVVNEAIRANEYLATHALSQYFKEYR